MNKTMKLTKSAIAVFIAVNVLSTVLLAQESQSVSDSGPTLNRLMLFKYKAEVSQAEIDEVKQVFLGLKDKVPGMIKAV